MSKGVRLRGVWRLIEWSLVSERGVEAFGMGEAPSGLLLVTKGWLSLAIQQADWPRSERRTRPGSEEMLALAGSWTARPKGLDVQIDLATRPDWIGRTLALGVQHSTPGNAVTLGLTPIEGRWLCDTGPSEWTERLLFARVNDDEPASGPGSTDREV